MHTITLTWHSAVTVAAVACGVLATVNRPNLKYFSWLPAAVTFTIIALFFV